ncbi:hypothetical protein [Amycolatopsis sp. NPDC058986]|uniref:hypothetical protein n=1 Tax=unclassified Amycolatopsis TaxID=2618356 RepID=UPI00366F9A65
MADDPENSNGFTKDGTGVYAKPDALPSSGTDFQGWTWKQIEAAIVGGAAIAPGSDGMNRAKEISDPQSLYDASVAFYAAQKNLTQMADIIDKQAAALTGEHGSWKGPAAEQFGVMMKKFSAFISSRANQLSGGKAGTGVAQQLYQNSLYLEWAQNTIRQIDSYYATMVHTRDGATGQAHIANYPDLVTKMTEDMAKVGKQLADDYRLTVDQAITPDTSSFDKSTKDDFDKSKIPPPDTGGLDNPPDLSGGGPDMKDFSATPPPGGGDVPSFGGTNAPGDLGGDVPSFGGTNAPGGLGGDVPSFGGTNAPGGLGGDVPSFGGTNAPGGLGGDVPSFGNTAANIPPISPFPGSLTSPGSGSGSRRSAGGPGGFGVGDGPEVGAANGLGDPTKASFPGDLSAPAPGTNFAAGKPDKLGGLNGLPLGGGTGAGGAPQPGSPFGRSDAAGLIEDESAPWTGVGAPEGLGEPTVGDTPATAPAEWSSAGGTPGFPGSGMPMGGGGGAAPPGERPGRSDAAGLIEDESAPWAGVDVPADLGEPVAGETPATTPAEWSSAGGVPAFPGGMPVGGAAASPDERPGRSDAAGLIEDESEPWAGAALPADAGTPTVLSETAPVEPASWAEVPGGVPLGGVTPPGERATARSGAAGPVDGEFWTDTGTAHDGPAEPGTPSVAPRHWAPEDFPAVSAVSAMTPFGRMVDGTDPPGSFAAATEQPDLTGATAAGFAVAAAGFAANVPRDPGRPGPSVPAAPETHRDGDRVPVVDPPSDTEDSSSWDIGVAALLPLAGGTGRSAKREASGEEPAPVAYQRRTDLPPVGDDRFGPMCSGADPDPVPEEDDADDEDQEERSMADLLSQDDSAWGRGGPRSSGVLE